MTKTLRQGFVLSICYFVLTPVLWPGGDSGSTSRFPADLLLKEGRKLSSILK